MLQRLWWPVLVVFLAVVLVSNTATAQRAYWTAQPSPVAGAREAKISTDQWLRLYWAAAPVSETTARKACGLVCRMWVSVNGQWRGFDSEAPEASDRFTVATGQEALLYRVGPPTEPPVNAGPPIMERYEARITPNAVHTTGRCSGLQVHTPRSDAWGCSFAPVTGGVNFADPCFTMDAATVVCAHPFNREPAVVVSLTQPLPPRPAASGDEPMNVPPTPDRLLWGIELEDGTQCEFYGGTGAPVAGAIGRVNYSCDSFAIMLAGNPDVAADGSWMIQKLTRVLNANGGLVAGPEGVPYSDPPLGVKVRIAKIIW